MHLKQIIGLTGGMGCGKSTVSAILKAHGLTIVDADVLTRKVHRDPEICARISEVFGQNTVEQTSDGPRIHRQNLAKIAFLNQDNRQKLDQIMQKALYHEAKEAIAGAEGTCILDAPLLFEAHWDAMTDWNVVVVCPMATRVLRIQARDGIELPQIMARLAAQMNDEQRCQKADYILYNTSTLDVLARQVSRIFGIT